MSEPRAVLLRRDKAIATMIVDDQERDEAFACFGTQNLRIGTAAFFAKRKPEFVGR